MLTSILSACWLSSSINFDGSDWKLTFWMNLESEHTSLICTNTRLYFLISVFPLWKYIARLVQSNQQWTHLYRLSPGITIGGMKMNSVDQWQLACTDLFLVHINPDEWNTLQKKNLSIEFPWGRFQCILIQETRMRCNVCLEPITGSFYTVNDSQPMCGKCHQVDSFQTSTL